ADGHFGAGSGDHPLARPAVSECRRIGAAGRTSTATYCLSFTAGESLVSGRTAPVAETVKSPVRQWRAVALPAEHGGWSFWLEPILLGLLLAPTIAGLWLALASFGVFLSRQPFKIAWADRQRGRRF